ncbi:MAG: FecR domain-containing protein [Prolixibacteraceae bacterium]
MDDPTYYRILSGTASREEKEIFFLDLKQDPDREKEFVRVKRLWDLNQIGHIRTDDTRKKALFETFWSSVHHKKRKLPHWLRVSSYAAAVLFAMAGGAALYAVFTGDPLESHKEFHAEYGSISSVRLEDGSKIWLNSNTTLSLTEKEHEVTAKLSGEAYFEIKHDARRTFLVDLGKIRIRDLGTTFNVSAYPDDNFFRATLLSGEIAVLGESGEMIRNLAVNQTFRFDRSRQSHVIEELDANLVTGWTENKFVFIDKPLAEICREIEKWYGVSVRIEDETLKPERYTSMIRRTTTVRQMMEMFRLTTGINYRIEEWDNKRTVVYLTR